MTRRSGCVLPLALALALASTSNASAAETPLAMPAQASNPAAGVTTQTGQGGFALVTFGAWPNQELNPRRSPSLPVAVRPLRAVAGGDRPGNFRRAIYLPHVAAAERQYALPPGLLDALIWTESRYNPWARSKAGAVGLGQLMPGTAQAVGVANRYDPKASVWGAARYLSQMIQQFGAIHLAVAAYNAGPGAVQAARGIPSNAETPKYVQKTLKAWRQSMR